MIKGLSDVQQKMLEQIIDSYMTIETSMKKKGLVLTDELSTIIKQSSIAYDLALKNNLSLPKSTYDIPRYGPTLEQEIFTQLDKFSQYAKIKKRVRKGIQYVQVLTWDNRSIENILKKTDKPKIKSLDDKKVFKEFLDNFTNFNNFSKDLEVFTLYKQLFIAKNDVYKAHFLKGENFLKDNIDKKEKIAQIEKEFQFIAKKKEELEKNYLKLDEKIIEVSNQFYTQNHTGRAIKNKQDRINTGLTSEPLIGFAKILFEMVSLFDMYSTKQNVNLSFEESGVLQSLLDSTVSPDSSIDNNYNSLVDLIINNANIAYGKKHWYNKLIQDIDGEKNLKTYLTSGPGFNAWYEARQFSKDIAELKSTQEFIAFSEEIDTLEDKKISEQSDINRNNERFRRFSQDIIDLQTALTETVKNLQEWSEEIRKN